MSGAAEALWLARTLLKCRFPTRCDQASPSGVLSVNIQHDDNFKRFFGERLTPRAVIVLCLNKRIKASVCCCENRVLFSVESFPQDPRHIRAHYTAHL